MILFIFVQKLIIIVKVGFHLIKIGRGKEMFKINVR